MTSPTPVDLPDGTRVFARGLRNGPVAAVPDYGLYLGGSRLRRHEPTLTWPHAWIDWPDFLLPRDRPEAIRLIRATHSRAAAGEVVEIACGGGVGRTGTVLSCLAILSGVAPTDAVAWTRQHYLPRAVETPWQKRWVEKFPTS
ncbi:protein-tyrosine phosphatase family protein [Actinokineospora globicatena]|uniref:protein-tyrosine phosphatase family protein n=1 Tax=Actinokineospora globicatena TaxID=103729 RepID=UPI0020A35150|nr:protein-tyrosine phosphatase family protein [Actinokineospora globicatena]MCP2301951.1 Protein-tyrosine phosphatase [Actinokineospora globicatena]GLW76389.1 protein-tyrosine-phosphatase [Actinokineospora globicatena]GLW83224.1 protein-tyrosine-phosphatase [Actinokineospora globicatena]